MIESIFNFLIFPGFLFTAIIGMVVSWIDRKVTARVQWRVGPPFLQPLYDLLKLSGKETIIPKGGAKWTFLLAPVFGFIAIITVSTMIWLMMLSPEKSFLGDLIVVIYILAIPSIALIIGASASNNPLASIGASREMKLILAYELPFILAILVPVIKAGGSIRLGEILISQLNNGVVVGSWSGLIAFLVALICLQAKMTLVPFDMPEAEQEIMAGAYIEYSGIPLGIYKLNRMMMLFVGPMVLVFLFMGGIYFQGWHILWGILKYVLLLVLAILIRNTNPRVRIDQAVRFFWGPVTLFAIIAILLAFLGY